MSFLSDPTHCISAAEKHLFSVISDVLKALGKVQGLLGKQPDIHTLVSVDLRSQTENHKIVI